MKEEKSEERQQQDQKVVTDLLQTCKATNGTLNTITRITRSGRQQKDKNTPIIVAFGCLQDKKDFFKYIQHNQSKQRSD